MSIRSVFILLWLSAALCAADSHPAVDVWGSHAALSFEPNLGQTSESVRYLAHTGQGMLYLTDTGVVFASPGGPGGFEVAGGNPAAVWEPLEAVGRTTSYRIGRDRSRWVEDVPGYRRLVRRQVYPGIDLVYYGKDNRLEYDFRVAPHADPARIRLRFPGARSLAIALDGSLTVQMAESTVRHQRPVVYQTLPDGSRREIAGEYQITGDAEAAFRVAKHDPALELSIDPVLDSSTFLGGSADDSVIAAAGAIAVGNTDSLDLPGAPFGRRVGTNVFVRFPDRTVIFGATGNVVALSASIVPNENFVVVGGYTNAKDLPTTVGIMNSSSYGTAQAWQSDFAGGETDGFILALYDRQTNYPVSEFFTYVGTPGDDRVTAVFTSGSYFLAAGSTDGRGLPSAGAATYVGVSEDAAAGVDGFLIRGYSELPYSELFYGTTYFGGSGRDTPLSVFSSNYGDYVAGSTTSTDFPAANGMSSSLKGLSDAFVMCFPPYGGAGPATAILYGGTGTESGMALDVLADGTVVLAGTTSSTDLPLAHPAQGAYGGGVSDGFLAMFPKDLSSLKYATYIGGSGADEAASLAHDYNNANLFVGGWTASLDFPLLNPLQPTFGGGPTDGFVMRYDRNGNLQDSTYFGGSGRDRVLSVIANGGSAVTVAGVTSSADLPLTNAAQSNLGGVNDGFVASMSSNGFWAPPVANGKDLRAEGYFYIGNAAAAASAIVTITSSDPNTVQLAVLSGDPGQASIQVSPSPAYGGTGAYIGYYVTDCLSDRGGATLTLSAAGHPDLAVPVTCYPSGVIASFSSSQNSPSVTLAPRAYTILSVGVGVNSQTAVVSGYIVGLRPGASPITVAIANSNSSVATLSQSTVTLYPGTPPSGTTPQVTVTGVAPGQTQLSLTASGPAYMGGNPLTVTVTALLSVQKQYVAPSGFQSEIGYANANPTQPIVVTSQDPSRVLLSLDQTQTGSASVNLSASSGWLWLQAVGSTGDVTLTFSPPGETPVSSTVHVTTPTLVFPDSQAMAQPYILGVGETFSVAATFGGADPQPSCCYTPNPGNNITLSMTASNTQAISAPLVTTSTPGYTGFQVTGVAPGNTVLSVHSSVAIPPAATSRNVAIKVTSKRLRLSNLELGNNLQAYLTLTLPETASAATTVQVTTSDPTLVLLSTNQSGGGQPQIGFTISSGAASASIFVYGLAASGQAQITATVSGIGAATGTVYLDPSGFAWGAPTYAATLYTTSYSLPQLPSIMSYALDRTTLLPLAQQSLRPGISATVSLVNQNPNIATLSVSTYQIPASGSLGLTPVSAGTGTIGIVQPAGFSPPSANGVLTVTIETPTLSLSSVTLANNLQAALSIYNLPGIDLPLTVTSSDPSRVLVSASPTAVGSASVTVNKAGWSNITLQALADNGTVTITASMPTFNSGTMTISLVPTGIGLNVIGNNGYPPQGIIQQNGQYYSSTQSPASALTPAIFAIDPTLGPRAINGTLRAGVGPLQVSVVSSNTAVATIAGSPLTLNVTQYGQQATVTFTPAGIVTTNVTVSQPAGFKAVPGYSTLVFNVTAPTLTTSNYILAKDTFLSTGVSLGSNVTPPTANVAVTLTSSDPSRVLLSPDAVTPPAASITATLIAGHNLCNFYVHTLANNGTVPIQIGAPGYTSTTMSLLLTDLTFTFNQYISTPITATLQNGAQTFAIAPSIVVPASSPSNYSMFGAVIRPGVTIPVSVTSSDSTIVSVSTPQVVFSGGMTQSTVTYVPQKAGSATLSLGVPAGYASPGKNGQLAIDVIGAQITFGQNVTVGRDLQMAVNLGANGTTKPSTVTVTSSDPTRLLVSADGRSAGQASVNVTFGSNGSGLMYLQGLTDNGTVNVSASAPTYQTGTAPVTLAPSAAVFTYPSQGNTQFNLASNAPLQQPQVVLAPLDPVTLRPNGQQLPRPGANVATTVTSSNPTALAVDSPAINFAVPDPSNAPQFSASLQPLAAGTAIVSLGEYPTAGTPAYGASLVYNLAEPNLVLPGFSLGQDLVGSTQISLGSSVPTSASNLAINLSSYGQIGFSTTPTGTPTYSTTVTILAGQRTSQPFYVQATQPGVGTINYYAGNASYSTSGNVTPTSFIFKEAGGTQPATLSAGSNGSFTVIPTMAPQFAAPLSPLSIRPGVTVSIAVISSNPSVLSVLTPRVFLNSGDRQVTASVMAVSPGQATLTLTGLTYDFTQPQASLTVTVK